MKIFTFLYCCIFMLSTVQAKVLQKPLQKQPMATAEYCTGFNDVDYNFNAYQQEFTGATARSWINHAMIWKSMVNSNSAITFAPGFLSPGDGVTQIIIHDFSSNTLNNQEANSGDFFSYIDGETQPANPAGSWNQVIIEDSDTALIYAAMNIWQWGTPVFTNIAHHDGNNNNVVSEFANEIPHVAAIQCVTLSAPNGPPHLDCDWGLDGGDFVDQAGNCDVIIESVKLSTYNDPLLCTGCGGPTYTAEQVISANTYQQLHNNANNHSTIFGLKQNWVVVDPPESNTSSKTIKNMLNASKRTTDTLIEK